MAHLDNSISAPFPRSFSHLNDCRLRIYPSANDPTILSLLWPRVFSFAFFFKKCPPGSRVCASTHSPVNATSSTFHSTFDVKTSICRNNGPSKKRKKKIGRPERSDRSECVRVRIVSSGAEPSKHLLVGRFSLVSFVAQMVGTSDRARTDIHRCNVFLFFLHIRPPLRSGHDGNLPLFDTSHLDSIQIHTT